MDEAKKPGKKRAVGPASVRKAVQRTMDVAAGMKDIGTAEARLIVDMPIGRGAGQVRMVLTDGPMRISAWGSDPEGAMREILSRMKAARPARTDD